MGQYVVFMDNECKANIINKSDLKNLVKLFSIHTEYISGDTLQDVMREHLYRKAIERR